MADEKDLISQEEIERLLLGGQAGSQAKAEPQAPSEAKPVATPVGPDEIEAMLAGSLNSQAAGVKPAAKPAPAPPRPAPSGEAEKPLGQGDLDKLLGQSGKAPPASTTATSPTEQEPPNLSAEKGDVASDDLEFLLSQAERALASIDAGQAKEPPSGVVAFRLEEFSGAPASTENATLDLLRDVELDLRIELGRTHMYLEDVLRLRRGSVVPLDKMAGDPVDIFVNGRLIARGEVLVLNDNFCVRVAELISGAVPAG